MKRSMVGIIVGVATISLSMGIVIGRANANNHINPLDEELNAPRVAQAQPEPSTPIAAAPATIAPIHFDADPENKLPVMSLETLADKLSDSRSNFSISAGDRLHINIRLSKDDVIGRNSIFLIRSPEQFLQERFHIDSIPKEQLKPINAGDRIEIVCTFRGHETIESEPTAGQEWYFRGEELKVDQ